VSVQAGVSASAGGGVVSAWACGVEAMMAGAPASAVSVARRVRSDRLIGI